MLFLKPEVDAISSGATDINPYWINPDGQIAISSERYARNLENAKTGRYKWLSINSDRDLDSFYEGAGYIKIDPTRQWIYR